jgi:hypothetical protein
MAMTLSGDEHALLCCAQRPILMCRWEVLQRVLEGVRSVRGNHSAYLDLVSRGEHILNLLPGGVLTPWVPPAPAVANDEPVSATIDP